MMTVLIICVVLLASILTLNIILYRRLSKKFNYAFGNHKLIYSKVIETELLIVEERIKHLEEQLNRAINVEDYHLAHSIKKDMEITQKKFQELVQEYHNICK